MTNIIQFPARRRIEVTFGTEPETGEQIYLFEHVDGGGRLCLATFTTSKEVSREAAILMADGCDVVWEEETRRILFGNTSGDA